MAAVLCRGATSLLDLPTDLLRLLVASYLDKYDAFIFRCCCRKACSLVGRKELTMRNQLLKTTLKRGYISIYRWLVSTHNIDLSVGVPYVDTFCEAAASGADHASAALLVRDLLSRGAQMRRPTVRAALEAGNLELVRFILQNAPHLIFDTATHLHAAARSNQKEVLQLVLERWPKQPHIDPLLIAAQGAAEAGNVELFKLLWKQLATKNKASVFLLLSPVCSSKGIFQFVLEEQGVTLPQETYVTVGAIRKYNFELARWLHEVKDLMLDWKEYARCAARKGLLEEVKYAVGKGAQVDSNLVIAAATGGNLKLLHWFDENFPKFAIRDSILMEAVRAGSMDIVRWALDEKRYLRGPNSFVNAYDNAFVAAMERPNALEFCEYLVQQKCPLSSPFIAYEAARQRRLDMLKWLRMHKAPFNSSVMDAAISSGSVQIVEWLLEQGFGWTGHTWENSASNGYLTLVKLAHRTGCVWTVRVCHHAIYQHDPLMLRYAREHGAPWTRKLQLKAEREMQYFEQTIAPINPPPQRLLPKTCGACEKEKKK